MKLVWTEAKLTTSGPSLLRKILMILQVNDRPLLTLVIRGDNSEQKLREALLLIHQDELFPLSLLVSKVVGGKQYYSVTEGGYRDNGVKTLQDLVKREVQNRARSSPQTALEYTKYAMQRNESFDMDDWLSPETLHSTIRELFDYAFSVDISYVRRACSDVGYDNICAALPPDTLFNLAQLIIDDQDHKLGKTDVAFSTGLMESIVVKLQEVEHSVPEGVMDYGIKSLQKEYNYDKIKDYALDMLVRCYRQSKSLKSV